MARWFWLRASHEIAIKMLAGASHLKAELGLEELLPRWQVDADPWQQGSVLNHAGVSIGLFVVFS